MNSVKSYYTKNYLLYKKNSGFDYTNKRLDLLALDKNGALVIIENKIDDSSINVTCPALEYFSYYSSLKNVIYTTLILS